MNTDVKCPEFTMEIGDPEAFGLAAEENHCRVLLIGTRKALIAHGLVPEGCFPDGIGETDSRPGEKERTRTRCLLNGFEVVVRMMGRNCRGDYWVTISKTRNWRYFWEREQVVEAFRSARRAIRKDKPFHAWLKRMIAEAQTFQDDEGEPA